MLKYLSMFLVSISFCMFSVNCSDYGMPSTDSQIGESAAEPTPDYVSDGDGVSDDVSVDPTVPAPTRTSRCGVADHIDPDFSAVLTGLVAEFTDLTGEVFSENFDSLIAGKYAAVQSPHISTWSGPGAQGTAEDAVISTVQASSGLNSMYITGFTDIFLPFPFDYSAGLYTFRMKMYVPIDRGAYFGLQTSSVVGVGWLVDLYLDDAGVSEWSNNNAIPMTHSFINGVWTEVRIDINFDTATMSLYFDNVLKDISLFTSASLGGVNLFAYAPNDLTPEYYVDDIWLGTTVDASYAWDFGDGSTSTEKNPSHTFDTQPTADICLSVTNLCGTKTHCEAVTICAVNTHVVNNYCQACAAGEVNAAGDDSLGSSTSCDVIPSSPEIITESDDEDGCPECTLGGPCNLWEESYDLAVDTNNGLGCDLFGQNDSEQGGVCELGICVALATGFVCPGLVAEGNEVVIAENGECVQVGESPLFHVCEYLVYNCVNGYWWAANLGGD